MSEINETAGEPKPITMPGTGEGSSSEGVAADELKAIIERAENVEAEIAQRREDFKTIMQEAKSRGFDMKALRTILRLRKKDHSERQEEEAILEMYMQAIGMV